MVFTRTRLVYTNYMTKRLVDLDDEAEAMARSALGTSTYRATVNQALRKAGERRPNQDRVNAGFDKLGTLDLTDQDRVDAWRR